MDMTDWVPPPAANAPGEEECAPSGRESRRSDETPATIELVSSTLVPSRSPPLRGTRVLIAKLLAPRRERLSALFDKTLQKDSPVYRYVKPMETVRGSQRLTDAAVYARAYVEACASPEARALDEQASSGIRARTHMATITSTGGFQWIPGFEPANESE
jgi:hypothetical protein